MTAEIIEFKRPEEEVPHCTGEARCLDCKHTWAAVAPLGVIWLECPACSLVRGRFVNYVARGDHYWECNCGNDLFKVTPDFIYCPNCGQEQTFP